MASESSVTDKTRPVVVEPQSRPRTHAKLLFDIASGRTELAMTLDAIEDKLNVKKKVTNGAHRVASMFRKLHKERPVVFVALGVGVAAAAGAVAWLSARAIFKD